MDSIVMSLEGYKGSVNSKLRSSIHNHVSFPYQSLHNLIRGVQFWNVHQESESHGPQGIGGPLREPVNGTAVNQGRELSQAGSENLSQGTRLINEHSINTI